MIAPAVPLLSRLGRFCMRLLDGVVIFCLAGMVIMVFGNVVLRYGFNSGITQSEELSRWLFVWMVFCGAAVVLKEGGHIAVDFVVQALPRPLRLAAMAVGTLLMIVITLLVVQGAWVQVQVNRTSFAPASGLSLSWFFLAGLVFGISALVILVHRFLLLLRGREPERTGMGAE